MESRRYLKSATIASLVLLLLCVPLSTQASVSAKKLLPTKFAIGNTNYDGEGPGFEGGVVGYANELFVTFLDKGGLKRTVVMQKREKPKGKWKSIYTVKTKKYVDGPFEYDVWPKYEAYFRWIVPAKYCKSQSDRVYREYRIIVKANKKYAKKTVSSGPLYFSCSED